ncbi:uncharacterized protein LOC123542089 isoform X2 [Mercenaria mercenaria]|uniref:uncharacterized protein LOC123542089 isoform X2 n=1 Tax=Mercenaria mercenaria TaxID=6596 RepID=UPI00234F8B38|nr:uncharacterized protein LOC123542089 isoform X2 [Mercenaria mercenaria]
MKPVYLFMVVCLQLIATRIVDSNNLDVSDIRLADGSGPFGGRVEIQIDGVWGTVCDRDFHINDATVMCRMMDLLPTAYFSGAYFGRGVGPVFVQEFNCYGYETHLRNCGFESNVFCSSHSRDVGIICSECGQISVSHGKIVSISGDGTILTIACDTGYEIDTNKSICQNGSWSPSSLACTTNGYPLNISGIRLENGLGISDGIVEILVNGTWGTICRSYFSSNEANVICNMLGFLDVYTYSLYGYYGFGQGPVLIDNLVCDGTESHINQCTYDVVQACSSYRYYRAEISCKHPLNVTDIRLVEGTGPYDGRVEIYSNGLWGTACRRHGYGFEEVETFCRMLNSNFTLYFNTPVYGQGNGPILVGRVDCDKAENDISDCSYYPPYKTYCSHYYDLTLVCTPCGQKDIANGNMESVNGSDIIVKCDVGYKPDSYIITCLSNGTWLQEENCSLPYEYPLNIDNIRLANSYIHSEGRVEIMVNGTWGTICDNNFDIKSANVTCHMIGLTVLHYYTNAFEFGQGSGPVYIDNLNCTGFESHINNCTYDVDNKCTHRDDVSVICTGYQLNITNIRLAGTSGPYHGRVELEVNGTWGTVGDDYFGTYEARVVCRMLGLGYRSRLNGAYYGQGSGPILVDRLDCPSSATHINQCKYSVDNYYNTQHNEDVSVICWGPPLNITEARLANGTDQYDGRAEIKVNGTWGTICDSNFDMFGADLFCNMLGLRAARYFTGALYGEGSGPIFIDQLYCDQNDADLSSCQYLFLNECTHDRDISVVCNECGQPDIYYWDTGYFSYNGSILYADCSYYRTYVGTLQLTCDNSTNTWIKEGECEEYSFPLDISEIRLVDGPRSTNGRVEIKSLDTWGTICDHYFGMEEANTICSMIGYPPAAGFYISAHYGEGTGPIFVDDLSCEVNASHINNCTYDTYDNCNHGNDISVNCTECVHLKVDNGFLNSTATNYGAVVLVSCDRDHKLIGNSDIICQVDGSWSDMPVCSIIDCGDPTPEHGSSNATSTINGTIVSVECEEGYDMVGDDIISCQENASWTAVPVCKIKDCGYPSVPYTSVSLPNNKTTFGETILISCWTGYTLTGSPTVTCLSNGNWEMMPSCIIVDCEDPTPIKGSVDKNETKFGTVVEVSCDPGYDITGNSTIICQDDGTWSDHPVCDASDCGLLSVPNGKVNDSQGTTTGSVAVIECDEGYDIKGTQFATCLDTGTRARWNYSVECEIQVCDNPKPDNGQISKTDGTDIYVFETYAEIECNTGYKLYGDNVITCEAGGVWSDNTTCMIFDCGSLSAPTNGTMDSQGTKYNDEIKFSCNEGFLLVGEENSICGETGEWSNDTPECVVKSDVGGSCINEDYCLLAGSQCINSVCTCTTGIYDDRTKKCDTMPLMPFGEDVGDILVSKRAHCGPKVSFEPGLPVFDKMHTDLYVCASGLVSFDSPFAYPTPPANKLSLVSLGQQRTILAPFFGPRDKRESELLRFRSYDILNSHKKMEKDSDLILYIETIVEKFENLTSYDASFVLIATWYKMKAIGSGYDKTKTSTFQVVLTSNGKSTYAFYIYGNGMMQWVNNLSTSPNVWVGYTVNSITKTHPYSFTNAALQMDSKLTSLSAKKADLDVAGLIFIPLNSRVKQHDNHAVDCIRWYNANHKDKKRLDYIASLTPECPCDIRLSRFDPWFWRIGLFRWRHDLRYKCVDMLHVGNFGHYGKSCCYDLTTWLWVYERPLAGSFQLYNPRHPLEHKVNDVQPKEKCCVLSKYCNLYYELRPTGSCYRTSPYNFGTFWGDPHFTTLDGLNFTFNGLGEYTLLQINTGNCSFDLQARTERAIKGNGNLSDATVFTAFAAKDSNTTSVHVERNNERTGVNLYGNKVDLTDQYNSNTDETDPFSWSSQDEKLTISKQNGSVNVFFPACNVSLIISIGVEMLSLSTFVPENLKNLTKGLLGNYNGDPSDDFAMPNGTVLKPNLTEREIFEYGKTWTINPNNSAFVYDDGKSHFDFHNNSFVPRFLDVADPKLRAKATEICNGPENTECVFDYVSTENRNVAEKTKQVKGQAEEDKKEIEETVPLLEGCSTVNVTKGQSATCKISFEAGDKVHINSTKVRAEFDQMSSTVTFVPETDEPVSIRVAAENENGRLSPDFSVSILLCTACNGHGVCTGVPRNDPRENEYFRYSTCECDPEYEGPDCERVFDGCATKPCSLDRSCTSLTAEQQKMQNRSYICEQCPDGFEDDGEDGCIDIDECAVSNGKCEHNCTNTDGSFECTCKDGFRVNSRDTLKCKDINECEEAIHNCDQLCNNTQGGFICQCYAGYRFNTTLWSCIQISDGVCDNSKKIECSKTHGCTRKDTVPVCFCKDGYELDETGKNCKDIDECGRGICPQGCVNTNGSFQCTCITGYRLEGVATCTECDALHWGDNCEQDCICTGQGADRCDPVKGCVCEDGWYGDRCNDDINECESDHQACNDSRTMCVNSVGSYTCECRAGFHKTDEGDCKDTDECSDPQLNNCMQKCTNTLGGYSCGCRDGYTKIDKWSCKDIDECELGTSGCEQRCVNNQGRYSCFCHIGYSINDDRRTCRKRSDPCLSMYNLTCSHFCLPEVDHAVCGCRSGYILGPDSVSCIDIDECNDEDKNKCSEDAKCTNTDGSFLCECPGGKQLENDGRTCTECDDYHYGRNCLQTCSCLNGNCDKRTGCVCNPGWAGTRCDTDIDECSTEQVVCLKENSVCVNVIGSAICSCGTGYQNLSGVCQDIDECNEIKKNDCDQICINTEGSYTCSCQRGFFLDGKCSDIDECAGNHGCDQICENTVGSYKCSCEGGFRLSLNDRKTCLPEQECSEDQSKTCPKRSTCFVENGEVNCTCLKGYQGDDICNDTDECMATSDTCLHNCFNTEGSFICSCDVGFFLLEDKVTCKECERWKFGDNCSQACSCKQRHTETCDSVNGKCTCKSGWGGATCDEDVDECNDDMVCPKKSFCKNTNGSFDCKCLKGYYKTGSKECEECDFRHFGDNCLDDCTCNFENTADCNHTTGVCMCKQGWSGGECTEDINECIETQSICDKKANSTCKNTIGSFICECNFGFIDENNKCEDIDECLDEQMNTCQQVCLNTPGSFMCDCKTGFNMQNDECIDIDECDEKKGICDHSCNNTLGSYKCLCDTGFQLSTDGRTCEPCDMWNFGLNCESDCTCKFENSEKCDATTGFCTCRAGWNGTKCESDINECVNGTVCPDNSSCNNINGSFVCVCNEGFNKTELGECHDIDECEEKNNTCSQVCLNTAGSFDCSCENGYFLDGDNITCQECPIWTFGDNCLYNCNCNKTNTETCDAKTGTCVCIGGWNGTGCENDINECENETTCPKHSMCNNSDGSYNCTCNTGYRMMFDGNCEICPKGRYGFNCSRDCKCHKLNSKSCNHVFGNCTCKEGWIGSSCSEDIDECEENSTLCQSIENSTCENTNGSYMCRCNEGLREQGNICTDCDIWKYGHDCKSNCTCNISKSEYCDPVNGVCTCKAGWNGVNCENDIDECKQENICPDNSTCENSLGTFNCRCNKGYLTMELGTCKECGERHYGDNCSEECMCNFYHTKTCHHVSGNCSCIPGWSGRDCSDDVDECTEDSTTCNTKMNSTCENSIGSFHCTCNAGFREQKDMCLQCSDNTYGTNCTGQCNCHAKNSANEVQTCDIVTGICNCKSNWKGDTCEEDVDECEKDGTLCSEDENATCVNTVGWYRCDCKRGYEKLTGDNCVAGIPTTTLKPDSAMLIVAVVTIEIDLPVGTNLNAASVYISVANKLLTTLREYFKRFTDALLEFFITDISVGSIIAYYSVRYGTADKNVATKVVQAIIDLHKGTELVFDGRTVSATSDSYKDMAPCEILYTIIESCGEGYTCNVENDIPVCSLQTDQSNVKWQLVIGLSAAGLFTLIVAALLAVSVHRLRRSRKNKGNNYFEREDRMDQTGQRRDGEASGFNRYFSWKDDKGVNAGLRYPAMGYRLPRLTVPENLRGSNRRFNSSLADSTVASRNSRANWF